MVCVLFPFLARKDLVQLLRGWGALHRAYHSAWHTEVAASRMLINFVLPSTKRGKDCSVAAPSKEVLSKHSTPGICAGLGLGGTLKRNLFGWVNSGFFF